MIPTEEELEKWRYQVECGPHDRLPRNGLARNASINQFGAIAFIQGCAWQAEQDAKRCEGISGRSCEFDLGRLHCAAAIRANAPKTPKATP